MIDRIPRRLRVAFARAETATRPTGASTEDDAREVDFVAYGEDCILFGRTVLDGDRLSDMLNEHDEYVLAGVTVERFDGGAPMAVDEFVVNRDEIVLVHASGPRGNAGRRHSTSLQHLAIKMGRYKVRGFYHAVPGSDPVASIRRRRVMVPLTDVRIEYTIGHEQREVRAEAVILNREQIDWMEAIEPDRAEFPLAPTRVASAKQSAPDPG
ncbi:MAG: hypothetical protein QOI37_733 [Chloroflexota bacterium]|jgi:hypothetical protein|nr:hypothetical protein [Chloroflexota bacterium]MEA2653506.1 hypothetical protein [Chloroflexota bacterium]